MTEQGGRPVALVTGGSGDIGSAVCRELGRRGYAVAVHCRSRREAAEAVAGAVAAEGGEAFVLAADLRDAEEASALVDAAHERSGRLDVLVNNAGTSRDGLLMLMPEEDWDEVLSASLKSLYTVTRPALRRFIARRSGSIVNVSSLSGVSGLPGQTNYAAAKGGVLGFTRSLAREAAPFRIRVNAVAPGLIASRMVDEMPAEARERLVEAVPLGRTGAPEEVARAVAFLASDEASYITGHTLFVTGGLY